MWELIAANKRKSVILLTIMAMILIGAGMLIAETVAPGAWLLGGFLAFILWLILSLLSYYSGDTIFLASAGARQIKRTDHPTLFNIVEEMTIAAGLGTMPRIYIIDDPRPNAFATGRDPEHASVAVTAGLLNRLNRDEVQGVIAHELAHVQNRDVLYVMLAGVMIGVIALMADVFLYALWFGGGRHRSSSSGCSTGGSSPMSATLEVSARDLRARRSRLASPPARVDDDSLGTCRHSVHGLVVLAGVVLVRPDGVHFTQLHFHN